MAIDPYKFLLQVNWTKSKEDSKGMKDKGSTKGKDVKKNATRLIGRNV